jgi:4-hydroxy-tetrahydrodipicolinate synthase
MTERSIAGIYPMMFALFDREGDLSRESICTLLKAMVKHGVHGIGVLGLASEVHKLSLAERYQFMEWVAEHLNGTLPFCVTVAEPNKKMQIEFTKAAERLGARWVILQPPPVTGISELELIRYFGSVADKCTLPVAIQNAPQYLGVGISNSGLATMRRNHPNISLLKLEASAAEIAEVVDATEGGFAVFNGKAGVEIIDSLRAGCAGIIPGGESFDYLVHVYEYMKDKRADKAEELYRKILPLLTILIHSIDCYLSHGKRVLCQRLAITNDSVRPPSSPLTQFSKSMLDRYAAELGPL